MMLSRRFGISPPLRIADIRRTFSARFGARPFDTRRRKRSLMNAEFASIRNHHERTVFDAVTAAAPQYPMLAGHPDLLADVACVALNRMPPRYIRHEVDMTFYL